MKNWDIQYAEPAEFDLEDIYCYIAEALRVPETAKRQLARIVERISKLDTMPKRHPIYDRDGWREIGLRRMNVDHFAVFYLPDDESQTVTVLRILYGGRNIDEILYKK